MSFLDAKFVSSSSLSAFAVLFQFGSFAPRGFQWTLSLAKRTKREKAVFVLAQGDL